MGFKTYNVRIPDSFYHLNTHQVKHILDASIHYPLSNNDVAKYIEDETGLGRRQSKALANRVNSEDLESLHNVLSNLNRDDEYIKEIDYESSRDYATIRT